MAFGASTGSQINHQCCVERTASRKLYLWARSLPKDALKWFLNASKTNIASNARVHKRLVFGRIPHQNMWKVPRERQRRERRKFWLLARCFSQKHALKCSLNASKTNITLNAWARKRLVFGRVSRQNALSVPCERQRFERRKIGLFGVLLLPEKTP